MDINSVKDNLSRFKDKSTDIFNSVKEKISEIPNSKTNQRPKARNVSKALEFSVGGNSRQTPVNKKIQNSSPRSIAQLGVTSNARKSDAGISKNIFQGVADNFKLAGRNRILFYIGALIIVPILVISIGLYSFLSFSSYYSTSISYEFQNVTASKQVEASTDASSNFKITKLEETDSVSAFKNVTGEKVIGEKAVGKITIFNATPEIKVLKKGTPVTCVSASCNGLVYNSVNDLNLGPGNSVNDYEIIASDIGENYNLAINAGRFKVANFNSNTEIIASNIAPVSGGTPKKTVKVISAADIKEVEAQAIKDLQNILIGKIKANSSYTSQYIISDGSFTIEKISSETDKEGTEAEVVNTSLRAKGIVDGFPKDQIQGVLDEIKSSLAPEGYYLDDKFLNSTTNVVASSPGKISLQVSVSSVARPDINIDDLKKRLAGKSIEEAEEILRNVPNTKSFESEYTPATMPGFLRRVPSDSNRIQIRLNALSPQS